jgi:multiple sugar transport system permease protein
VNAVKSSQASTQASAAKVPAGMLLERLRTTTYKGERIEWSAYLFMLPFLLFFLIFQVLPILAGVFISFTKWGIVGWPEWIGLDNFIRILDDPDVPLVYGNTFRYALTVVPLTIVTALVLALYVNRRLLGYGLARTIFFAPTVLSVTVISFIWIWILETRFGILNIYLSQLGIPNIPWLTNPRWVLVSIALTSVWWSAGFFMVILLAGLQGIPGELYDAAYVDGAAGWQTTWYVTLPLLRPALSLVITLSLIDAMRVFSQMFLMTRGGPAGSSLSAIYLIYDRAFSSYQLGYGAALSLMLFAVILVITIVQLRIFRELAT